MECNSSIYLLGNMMQYLELILILSSKKYIKLNCSLFIQRFNKL